MKKKHLNWLFEFKDKKTEAAFLKETVENTKSFFIFLLFFYVIVYTLFSLLDKQLAHESALIFMAINRTLTFISILFLLFILYKTKSVTRSVTLMHIISFLLATSFLIIIYQYNNPTYFYIESLSIIIMTLGLYAQPIKTLFKIILSLFMNLGFIALMLITNGDEPTFSIIVIFSFLMVNLFVNIIIMYQSNFLKRTIYNDTKKLEKLSSTDYLTGVLSRGSFFEKAERALVEAGNLHYDITLIYIDFDGFKFINDHYGHDIGDKVLVEITQIISSELNIVHLFGRFGGDEFGILMIDYNYDESIVLINKFKKKITKYTTENEYGTTCTFGVAPYLSDYTLLDLIQKADIDLYKNKENKNR